MPHNVPDFGSRHPPVYPFASGASAGLGLALTRSILARGDYAIATARPSKSFDELRQDPSIDSTRLRFLTLDVTSPMGEIKQCITEALAIWGRIDVLVNNAGSLTFGISEELGYLYYDHPHRVASERLTFLLFVAPREL